MSQLALHNNGLNSQLALYNNGLNSQLALYDALNAGLNWEWWDRQKEKIKNSKFFQDLKEVVNSAFYDIGMGLVSKAGAWGAGIATGMAILKLTVNALGNPLQLELNITDSYEPKTQKERDAIIYWNENLYIPFLQKVEKLIIGTNQQKNQALEMLAIYENMLEQQLTDLNNDYIGRQMGTNNISFEGLWHRYFYVLDIHKDIRNMLTFTPNQKTIINTNDYKQEFQNIFNNIAYTEIVFFPTEVEVSLIPADAPVVDLNLNIPHDKAQAQAWDLTLTATEPTTADGRDIAEAFTDIIRTNETDIIKVEITESEKDKDTVPGRDLKPIGNIKQAVTITTVNNMDGTKTKEIVTKEVNKATGTSQVVEATEITTSIEPNVEPVEIIETTRPIETIEVIEPEIIETTRPTETIQTSQTTRLTETSQKNNASLANTFKQAVVFSVVAIVLNKIVNSKSK